MLKYFYKKTDKLSQPEQSIVAHSLLKEKLADYLGVSAASIEIKKDKLGCPYIENYPDIFISITHTDLLVACAFSDSRVGIDAEKIKARRSSVESRVFTSGEINLINNAVDSDSAFFTLWTLKECYLKAIGTGFADNAKSVEFLSLSNPIKSDKPAFSFLTELYDSCVISLCCENNSKC